MKVIHCTEHNCFQNLCGKSCKLLTAPPSTMDPCPFYKTQEEVDKGREWAHQELIRKDRRDLIEQYEYNPQRRGMW